MRVAISESRLASIAGDEGWSETISDDVVFVQAYSLTELTTAEELCLGRGQA